MPGHGHGFWRGNGGGFAFEVPTFKEIPGDVEAEGAEAEEAAGSN